MTWKGWVAVVVLLTTLATVLIAWLGITWWLLPIFILLEIIFALIGLFFNLTSNIWPG